MSAFRRDLYSIAAGTVSFSGTGNRTVTFSGHSNALAVLDEASNLQTMFGLGSLLVVGNAIYPVATINSTSEATLLVDGPVGSGLSYRLLAGIAPEAVIAGMLKMFPLRGSADYPFDEWAWDDGVLRYRVVTEGGLIKWYAGPTRPAFEAETAVNLVMSINPTTGAVTGMTWNPTAGATVVGRLARFTDTAGGLGQSQMSEDGSGNVTAVGSVTAGGNLVAYSSVFAGASGTTGYAALQPGDAARSGYLAFYNADGVRQGYMGDVAGGLISLYAEAGNAWSISGALTISGAVSALTTVASPGFIAVTGAAGINGYATLKHGDAAATGYLEFQHKDGTRRGYIGYASGGYINAVAEGGYGWNFSGNFLLGGDLALQRSNSGGAVGTDIQNTAAGASAAARLRLLTGTANSLITFQINDNTGSPFALEQSGSAISGIYKYHALHVWGSQAGSEWARLSSTAFAASVPIKLPSYTVGTVPSASTSGAGAEIYVTNETGGATVAFSDGTDWRRVTDRAIIS